MEIILSYIAPNRSSKMYKKVIIIIVTSFLLLTTPTYANHTNITAVIEKIMPAVVEIFSERHPVMVDDMQKSKEQQGGFQFRDKKPDRSKEPMHHGSGFVISADGYVITNAHVIDNVFDGNGIVYVTFNNYEEYETELVNYDIESDIALLKIKDNNKKFPFVVWGKTPEVGDEAIAIGSPMNLSFTATFGNVSAIDRLVTRAPVFVPFIQTDTSINPGNSGGPLFNSAGKLIGINTMIISSGEGVGSVGLGFAIDGNYAQRIIERLKTGEKITRPFIGILYRPVKKDDTIYYIAGQGAYIDKIVERGPAHNLLQPNDIILKVDGKAFKTKLFAVELVKRKPNTKIVFTIVRDEFIIDVELILGEK